MPKTGVYITDVVYASDTSADTENSKINYFTEAMMESNVVLGGTGSSITYAVTVYNSTDREQLFIKTITDKEDPLQYSNTNIGYSVASIGDLIGLEEYVTTLAPGETRTFPITFSYTGTDTDNNTLLSKLNFRFMEKPILELSNEGETYTLEDIYAGYTPAEYEFTVSNYNASSTNAVPMTYSFEKIIDSPLEAKIYNANGEEVTGNISIGAGNQEEHTYTLKIIWESGAEYNEETASCKVELKAKPTEEKYLDYEIAKEFNIDIDTTCIHNWENGVCTKCGEVCEHDYQNGKCTICGKVTAVQAGQKAPTSVTYSDGTNTAVIPEGFTVSGASTENIIDDGLVIYLIDDKTDEQIEAINWNDSTTLTNLQQTYDQFVWIPVNDINDMYMCQSEDGTKSCRITVQENRYGENVAYCTTHSSTLMAGRLYTEIEYNDMGGGYLTR